MIREATVIRASRRNASLLTDDHLEFQARNGSKLPEVVVGDRVVCKEGEGGKWIIAEIKQRKHTLHRSYREKTKIIAANLDHLFLITAVGPLFNTAFIDRVLLAAAVQEIPVTLVVNKADQGVEPGIACYEKLGVNLFFTSVKKKEGINQIEAALENPKLRLAALAGVSGVGKSSLINHLVPEAAQATAEVSERTGQGKQTTSMAVAYVYKRSSAADALLVDLPGIQNFGVSGLEPETVRSGFPEIAEYGLKCQFSNCGHIREEKCAVKEALGHGLISESRYISYSDIIHEIERSRPF